MTSDPSITRGASVRGRLGPALGVCVAFAAASGWARAAMDADPGAGGTASKATGPLAESERGIAGAVEIEYAGGVLRGKAGQNPTSPVLVRVVKSQDPARQRVEFLGLIAGTYDLREYLELEDGRPAADLPEIRVRVVSTLPPQAGTDVVGLADAGFSISSYYRELLFGAVAAWLAVPVVVIARRMLMRRPEPAAAPVAPPEPTLAEQLRAMLERAKAGGLGVEDRARLELLLLRFSGESLRRARTPERAFVGGPEFNPLEEQARTMGELREHPQTREVVLAVERWLHGPGASEQEAGAAAERLDAFRASRLDPVGAGPGGGAAAGTHAASGKGVDA